MTLSLVAEPPPLTVDEHGSVRVAGTRVLLEFIVRDQRRGLSPEQIAERHETIDVPTAYAVVAYYLKHKSEVDAYVARREGEAEDLRTKIEANLPQAPTKQELLSPGILPEVSGVLTFLVDEHVPPALVHGMTTRQPALDVVTVQDAGLRSTRHPDLLKWAARQGRAIITFDRNTLTAAAYDRIAAGDFMAGVVVVDDQMAIAQAIDELLIIAECSRNDELHGQVWYVPLR